MSFRASLACLFLVPCLLGQGTERLTLESIAHPTLKKAYVGTPATRLEWLPDGSLMQARREGDQLALLRVDPRTWESRPLIESTPLQAALVAAGATEADARAALGRGSFIWNEGRTAFLITVAETLFQVDVKAS
ncbi:MAG: hypothetical protein U0P46_06020, partial [Holophagaceae bacterium]